MRRYSLRSLFLGVVVIAFTCGWIADHWRLQHELDIERGRGEIAAADFETRLKAIRMLTAKGKDPDIPLLLYALSDPDRRVQHEALSALKQIPRPRFLEYDEAFDGEVSAVLRRWIADGDQ